MPSRAYALKPAAPQPSASYQSLLAAAQKPGWRIDEVVGGDRRLDFANCFMPESLARTRTLGFLRPREERALNQIRGHAYLAILGLCESFILPFVLDHARPRLESDDDTRSRALFAFAGEKAKHIHLFRVFRDEFRRGFGSACAVIGPPEVIAKIVLAHHPLGVALAILHVEWMVLRHYADAIRDDCDLDPQFKSLLAHHWMAEPRHAGR